MVYRAINVETGELKGQFHDLIPEIAFRAQAVGLEGSYIYAPDQFGTSGQFNRLSLVDISSRESIPLQPTNEGRDQQFPAFAPSGNSILFEVATEGGDSFISELILATGVSTQKSFDAQFI